VDELIGRMMAREPADRPEDMAYVEDELRSLLSQDDDVLSNQLAEEMRVLFVEELSEAALSGGEDDISGPWERVTSPFQRMPAGTATPPPAVLSESNPALEISALQKPVP